MLYQHSLALIEESNMKKNVGSHVIFIVKEQTIKLKLYAFFMGG